MRTVNNASGGVLTPTAAKVKFVLGGVSGFASLAYLCHYFYGSMGAHTLRGGQGMGEQPEPAGGEAWLQTVEPVIQGIVRFSARASAGEPGRSRRRGEPALARARRARQLSAGRDHFRPWPIGDAYAWSRAAGRNP